MPINKTLTVREDRILAIWHIEETFDQLLDNLSPRESDHALLLSFRNDKKRLEWLAGRLCLKHLTSLFGLPYKGIEKDSHGKPTLRSHSVEVSLTHSFPYVAAIIDLASPVGIDLEQPRDKVVRIAHKFLSDPEMEFSAKDARTLNFMWCAKETLFKIRGRKGVIFRENLFIEPFDKINPRTITGNIIVNGTTESYNLQCIEEANYIVTYNS